MDYGPFGLLKAIIETLGEGINKLRGRITHDKTAYPGSGLGLHDMGFPSEHTDKVPGELFWKELFMEKLDALEKERGVIDEMIIQDYEARHEAEPEQGNEEDSAESPSDDFGSDSNDYDGYIG